MDDDFGDDEDFGLDSFGDTQLQSDRGVGQDTASAGIPTTSIASSRALPQTPGATSDAGASEFDLYGDMHDGAAPPTLGGTLSSVPSDSFHTAGSQPPSQMGSSEGGVESSVTANGVPPPEPPPQSSSGGSAVFVGNLQWWTTDAEVEVACGEFGPVTSVEFTEDKSNGRSKGYARVHFSYDKAAALCKAGLNGQVINEKACVVTVAGPGPPPLPAASAAAVGPLQAVAARGAPHRRPAGFPGARPPPPAPPPFSSGRGQAAMNSGAPPRPDMFRPPHGMPPNPMMGGGMGGSAMGRGAGVNMGMMGRSGPMGGPIGGAMSGPMGGPPPNMMGRGMPGGMAAGMGPGGNMGGGNMGGGMHAVRGSGSMSGTGMMPFGGPGGMSLPSPFTAGASLSAGMPRTDEPDSKRRRQ